MALALASKPVVAHISRNTGKVLFCLSLIIQSAVAAGMEETECRPAQANSRAGFEQLFATAERLRQAAADADAEWLKTESLLTRSQQQAAEGNWNTAFQLAQKACRQAWQALQQAEHEAQAWKHRVVD